MRNLILEPHQDDAVLFASYSVLRFKPKVVTCFESHVQKARGGPDQDTRVWENKMALSVLGVAVADWWQLPICDDNPDVGMLREKLGLLAELEWGKVFAPAVELGGHEQHSLVGEIAAELWGDVTFYTTYVRGYGRTQTDHEVSYEEDWPAVKFKAMSCYISQLKLENTRPWFRDDWDREWYE